MHHDFQSGDICPVTNGRENKSKRKHQSSIANAFGIFFCGGSYFACDKTDIVPTVKCPKALVSAAIKPENVISPEPLNTTVEMAEWCVNPPAMTIIIAMTFNAEKRFCKLAESPSHCWQDAGRQHQKYGQQFKTDVFEWFDDADSRNVNRCRLDNLIPAIRQWNKIRKILRTHKSNGSIACRIEYCKGGPGIKKCKIPAIHFFKNNHLSTSFRKHTDGFYWWVLRTK